MAGQLAAVPIVEVAVTSGDRDQPITRSINPIPKPLKETGARRAKSHRASRPKETNL